jgi:hypothetical protein
MAVDFKTLLGSSVQTQLDELQPVFEKQADIAAVAAELDRLTSLLGGFPVDPATNQILSGIFKNVQDIQAAKALVTDFGAVLVNLYAVQQSLAKAAPAWIDAGKATSSDADLIGQIVLGLISSVRSLLSYRPDVGAILDDLTAVKGLRGGPADADAFHDFQVLQLAFKAVWMHAFDQNLKLVATQLYEETVRLYDDAGLQMPNFGAINDIDQLKNFVDQVQSVIDPHSAPPTVAPPSTLVNHYFPQAVTIWSLFSDEQRNSIESNSAAIEYHRQNEDIAKFASDPYVQLCKDEVADIVKHPVGNASRLTRLISEIGEYLSEPYAFDVFAPDSYNFGLLVTYRQRWTPGSYQAGDLVSTIPLAPGETRKFSKRKVVKTTRAQKEIERSMSSRSLQSSEVTRAEADIMTKVTTATNFKLTTHGSFNIGIGDIDSTTELNENQGQESVSTKKAFHEATVKAAQEYRLERTLEIDTTSSVEAEETVTGEISNPNNEITVTYLFYELQRRYRIHEWLQRVRPMILVAQDVPAPHEIDEAWLIEHQWIMGRVLLDDSLRPALDYLGSGFAGEEATIEILKGNWQAQIGLTKSLENQVQDFLAKRDWLRQALVSTQQQEDVSKTFEMSTALKVFTFGLAPDPAQMAADQLEAARKAYETRLQYSEQALADAQDKLKQASDSLRQASKDYATAMQNQYARHVAIDQLRVHVKQNILYYMQAIWDHEPPDQRFFRLYNKKVACPSPQPNCTPSYSIMSSAANIRATVFGSTAVEFSNVCAPSSSGGVGGQEHDLVEVADLDNPLGYKGNYIIFPLKGDCYLTTFMLHDFIDNLLGVRDPDGSDDFDAELFDEQWTDAVKRKDQAKQDALKAALIAYLTVARRTDDEIIVPTGQLFIEALPGSHPLLEDFKLMHRVEDVRKVRAEVRHAELENLRLASRLMAGQNKTELLDDPDIEKKIVVKGGTPLVVASGGNS